MVPNAEEIERREVWATLKLAVHLNGIAIDHRGGAGHVGQGRGGEQAQGDGEGAHGYSAPWLGEKE